MRVLPKRLATKLALVICVLVGVLLSILGIALTQVTQNVLKEKIRYSHEEIAKRAAREVMLFIETPVGLLKTAGKLIAKTRAGAVDQETILVELSLDFPSFEEIVSVNLAGKEIASSNPGFPSRHWSNQPPYREALKGQEFFSPITLGKDHLPNFTIAIPYRQRGQVSGVLIAKVNLRGVWDIVDGIHIGETGQAFILARDGLVIAHPDKKLVFRNKNLSSNPGFSPLNLEETRSVEFQDEKGEIYLGSFAPMKGPFPFIVVIQMKVREAYRLLGQMQILIWFVLMISLLVSILVSFFVARWLVRPIKLLQHWSHRVSLGDFEYRLTPRSSDELGRLFIRFKRMTERLKIARERERLAALGMAASTLSHKFKNSIVSLKTFSQLLPQRKNDVHFMRRFEKDLTHTIERLERIFKSLSQIVSPRPPHLEPVDMSSVLQLIRNSHEAVWERLNIEFHLDSSEELPFIQGDREQLQELFDNLVQNAVLAMPEGGQMVIRTSCSSKGPFAQISISDTGMGIPQKNLTEIFKPFFTTRNGGMGLGLAISKKIVEDHKGTISVMSEEGKGSVFTINLPLSVKKRVFIEAPHSLSSAG